jgi:hypothetical protein
VIEQNHLTFFIHAYYPKAAQKGRFGVVLSVSDQQANKGGCVRAYLDNTATLLKSFSSACSHYSLLTAGGPFIVICTCNQPI